MLLLGSSTATSVYIVHIKAKEARGRDPPAWMKVVFVKVLSKVFCIEVPSDNTHTQVSAYSCYWFANLKTSNYKTLIKSLIHDPQKYKVTLIIHENNIIICVTLV